MNKIRTIESLPIDKGKVVFVRVDYNVPVLDGRIIDDTRIVSSIPTIQYILDRGAIPVLLSHLGRPNGNFVEKYSLQCCIPILKKLLDVPIFFHLNFDSLRETIEDKKNIGGVFLVENIRFFRQEESFLKADRDNFIKDICVIGDFFVNDAFSVCHREHASVVDIANWLPSASGLLLQKELRFVGMFKDMQKVESKGVATKTAMILGGAKVEEKLPIIKHLLFRVDKFFLGGAMSCTFLHAMGMNVGSSLVSKPHVKECFELLQNHREKFILPQDVLVVQKFDFQKVTLFLQTRSVCFTEGIFLEKDESVVDIGRKTIELFDKELGSYNQIFWNGPMGVIENPQTAVGTKMLVTKLAGYTKKGVQVVLGGGDSLSALTLVKDLDFGGYCCMGGGALLEYLSGKKLPGLAVLGYEC